MDNQKKIQASLQKQWRQQWKISCRKLDDSQKSYFKILSTFSQINAEYSSKINGIISEYQHNSKKQEKQNGTVYGKLKKINESIDQLRQTLKYFDQTNQSLVKVQKLSEGVFSKMQGMKNQMANSYDELDDLQKKLTSDLNLIDRRVQAFDEQQQLQIQHQVPKKIKNKQNISLQNRKGQKNFNMEEREDEKQQAKSKMEIIEQKMKLKQKEVEKVEEQIRDLGKFLGWHEQDHKDFLTIWNRNQPNKTYFQIQDQLVQYFKMYTSQQIIDHMNKYMKLKKLNDKKKNLINQYKQLKQEKKEQQINKLKSNQHQRLIKLKRQQQVIRSQQQQKEMKQKVEQWKKQKQDVKLEEKRRLIEQQHKKKQLQLIHKRQEQNKRKQLLERWKQQQQEKYKNQKEIKQQPRRPQSAVNKETRDRIRERQQQIIKQKMQKVIEKKMQQQYLAKKAERIKQQKIIKFAYVNSKLQQKTTAVKQKQREKFDGKQKKQANTFGGQLLMTGVRAVPQWRQGL